jgi:hypothetical protein
MTVPLCRLSAYPNRLLSEIEMREKRDDGFGDACRDGDDCGDGC